MAQIGDLGIDLGTSNVLIYMKGTGIVLREPAVVAASRDTRKPIAIGADAYRMIGRTPGNMIVMRPLRNGTVMDFDLARMMLQYFINQVVGKRFFNRPRAILSLPTGVNDVEKRALISAMFDSGMRKTYLMDRSVAAALGVGLPFEKAYGTMIIDMGAGASDIAVLSRGQVAVSDCITIGGDYFNDAIIRFLRKKHNLLVGERTAEELKITIGSALPVTDDVSMEVTGRNLISGLPKTQTVFASEIYEALKTPVADLIEAIQGVLEHTPPQLINDVFDDGIILTGGAAALTHLSEAIYQVLHIPCGVADDPQTSVVMGCGRAAEELNALKHLLGDARSLAR
ncbi:MAG: rod shape-determining protein [Clostridia bacterium]|nr:rod shape-determining protein [Clostridia bacterium]